MHTNEHPGEQLKLHEALGVTALVAFVAAGVVISFAALALRGVVIDTVDQLKKKGS